MAHKRANWWEAGLGGGRWAGGSGLWAVGSGQWAVGKWAVGSWQSAVGSGQWARWGPENKILQF